MDQLGRALGDAQLQRIVQRAQRRGGTVAFGLDGASVFHIDQHARKAQCDAFRRVVNAAVGFDPVVTTVGTADPILMGVGSATGNDFVDGSDQSGAILRVHASDDLLQAQPLAPQRRVRPNPRAKPSSTVNRSVRRSQFQVPMMAPAASASWTRWTFSRARDSLTRRRSSASCRWVTSLKRMAMRRSAGAPTRPPAHRTSDRTLARNFRSWPARRSWRRGHRHRTRTVPAPARIRSLICRAGRRRSAARTPD